MPGLTPEQAVDRLEALRASACDGLRSALTRFAASGAPPTPQERATLPLSWIVCRLAAHGPGALRETRLGEVPGAGPLCYHRHAGRLLPPLSARAAAAAGGRVRRAPFGRDQPAGDPVSFVTEAGDDFLHADLSVSELARHFPTPVLANVGDEIADGARRFEEGQAAAARAVRRHAGRLFVAPAAAVHRDRLADDSALDPVHQLPALSRPIPRLGGGGADPNRRRLHPAGRCRAARWWRAARAPTPWRDDDRRGTVAPLPDAGLQPDAQRRQGRHLDRQYRRRPVERQDRDRPPGCATARAAG